VLIYFDNKVLRGNRSTKDNSNLLEAFSSPNMLPLARLDVNFTIDWDQVLKYNAGTLSVFKTLESNISFMSMSPVMNTKALKLVLNASKAVIIAGYGMGNLPSANIELMDTIKDAIQNGTLVIIKTQCHHGAVNDLYETGRALTKIGCLLAMDMTIECIFAKLSYLLGKKYT
jgi:L-asparaginase/Glu-tRNA(Gln) amidotransferase subunit D